jgi:arginine/ornithine N-succinyltransferase beta subunit
MQDLVRALLVPLREVKDAMAPIWDALKEQFLQAEFERANEPEALVVTALFSHCHAKDSSVLVGQIATWVNACRRNIGEEADLKPRAVGAILKSLGFTTDKLDSFDRGLPSHR